MKEIVFGVVIALATNLVWAQSSQPEWHATVKVVDDSGNPVSGADVEMSFYIQPPPGETEASGNVQGMTDANGFASLSHESTGSIGLSFSAAKPGYYSANKGYQLYNLKDSDPAKWNPNVTLVLKAVLHPIPMYAKRVLGGPPVLNQPVGYDLMAGDWVAPYGKGTNTDIIFETQKTGNDYKFTVSFPNQDDGIQEYTTSDAERGSTLRSPHEAPASGYQSRLVRDANDYDESRCYFFRVKSASETGPLYGKIYGDFMEFAYYLNPTPNSRDIEFNPKENLIQHFRLFAERVKSP